MPVPLLARQNAGIMGHKRYREREPAAPVSQFYPTHTVLTISTGWSTLAPLVNTGAIGLYWRHWSILETLHVVGCSAPQGIDLAPSLTRRRGTASLRAGDHSTSFSTYCGRRQRVAIAQPPSHPVITHGELRRCPTPVVLLPSSSLAMSWW